MKRTITTTLVLGGLLFVTLTALLGRQQRLLVWKEARAAEDRQRALAEALAPVSLPGEEGGAGAASPNIPEQAVELPVPGGLTPPARRLPSPMGSMTGVMPMGSMSLMSKPHDPTDAALDREAKQLAARVRAAQEPEKSKLRAELEVLTEKHFEHRQRRRAAEIAELADRVEKLRAAHQRRQENKPDILKRRLADLLDEENELKWDDARVLLVPTTPQFAPPPADPKTRIPNLDGHWLVTLPAGFEFVGKIEMQPEGCWSFQEMRNLSGNYQLEGSTLKGITTDSREPRGDYEWLILNDNVMVLTKAPQNIGSDYRGATLRRGAKPKASNATSSNTAEESSSNEKTTKLTDALVRAAETRRKLAEFEYTKAMEANKKVPGSISSTEIERLKANFDIANAELDAAKLGVDIRRTEKTKEGPSTSF